MDSTNDKYIRRTEEWLVHFVIRHNICPFASTPYQSGKIRFVTSLADRTDEVLDLFVEELYFLGRSPEISNTLFIIPNTFASFEVFLDMVSMAEQLMKILGLDIDFQLAYFHPDYIFEDASVDDPANQTNRSPFPTLHILRTEEVAQAIAAYGDTSEIFERNKIFLRNLGGTTTF